MGYREPGGAGPRCLCAPWWFLGDTASPAAELVAAGLSAEVWGRRGGGGRPHREGRPECAVCGGRVWAEALCGCGGGPDSDAGREGRLGQGTGPRAAGPEERVAVLEKDELVSGRPERRFSVLPLQAVRTKARAGVGKARTLQF